MWLSHDHSLCPVPGIGGWVDGERRPHVQGELHPPNKSAGPAALSGRALWCVQGGAGHSAAQKSEAEKAGDCPL